VALAAIVVLGAVTSGCSSGVGSDADSATSDPAEWSSPSGSSGSDPTGSTIRATSVAPEGFRAVTVIVHTADGRTVERCLLVADSDDLRQQGLMGVDDPDLGGYDGMLFVFEADSEGGFWMKDTLIPLSIAFADGEGAVVGTADMVPCPPDTSNCPVTRPDVAYRYAVEVSAGALEEVGLTAGATLDPTLGQACSRSG
jgi:uncharacterized membrane protein (UPF0127 family)